MSDTSIPGLAAARSFAASVGQHFIGGHWVAGLAEGAIAVIDPATEEPLGSTAAGGAADIDAAVAAARAAFEGQAWSRMPAVERERLLLRLADAIEANADEIAALETLDNGMPLGVARMASVGLAISAIRYNAGWVRKIGGATAPVSAPGEWHGFTTREAVGVAALIVPWNMPFAMTCNKVSAALAAGCTAVLKPAELTPLSALRLAQIVEAVGFPFGVLNVVTGLGTEAGAALVRHPGVDKVSFTGSTATGQSIARDCMTDLKRLSLELGGKSPVVVFPDADLARAIPAIAMGIFGNSGQVCAAGSRLFVHHSIHDAVIDGLIAFAARLKVGNGLAAGVNLGPLISAAQRDKVWAYIEGAKAEGATLVCGGEWIDGPGFFVAPTIFTDTTATMRIVREEIFGPVLSVLRFGDEDLDTIARYANDTPYGLSANIWTRDLGTAHRMARRIRAGSVKVNGAGMEFALPFGGFKLSGLGRENGREGVEAFTELKSVMISLD
jgi:acyl-CoA reductase-like NAD-dependent aldehyde dehydrogenase